MPSPTERDEYDPYRTPPLWIEPKAPLDHVHDEQYDGDYSEEHEAQDDGLDSRPDRPVGEFAEPLSYFSQGKSSMKFLDFLIPPINAHPEHLRRWRMAISLAVIGCTVSVPMMFGRLPLIPFSGFAYASDVTEIKILQLDKSILDLKTRHCMATTVESKQFYLTKIKEELRKMYAIDGHFDPPTCSEVMGVEKPREDYSVSQDAFSGRDERR